MNRLLLILLFFSAVITTHAQVAGTYIQRIGGATGEDYIQTIYTDPAGNVYVAGSFTGTVDFDPSAATQTKTALGMADAFVAKYNTNGGLLWVDQLGSTAGDDEIYAITTDASNVYVAGYFSGTVDFNPDASITQSLTSNGGLDIFFGRYASSNGAFGWVDKIGSTGNDVATSISLDGGTNLYVGGAFTGTNVDFDPSGSTLNKTSLGIDDAWFGKYLIANGNLVWAQTMGSTNNDACRALQATSSGVWVAGYYGEDMDIDPTSATFTPTTNFGGFDGYFAFYDGLVGSLGQWGTHVSSADDVVTSIAADASSVYIGGYFGRGVTTSVTGSWFDGASSGQNKVSSGGGDIYLAKYNTSTMAVNWLYAVGGTGDDGVNLLTLDAASNVYATGFFESSFDFDPNVSLVTQLTSVANTDGYLVKIHNNGTFLYGFPMGNPGRAEGTSVDVDGSGNLFVAGIHGNMMECIPGGFTSTSLGFYDGFFAKYQQITPGSEPTAGPTGFSPASIASTSYTVNFTAAAGGAAGYIAIRSTGAAPTTDPFDGNACTVGNVIGNGTVAYIGTGTSFNETAKTASTQYFYKIYAFNGSGTTINYRTLSSSVLSGSVTTTAAVTLAAEPTAQATDLSFYSITDTSYDFDIVVPSGSNNIAGYIGIKKAGSVPTFVPTDGVPLTTTSSTGIIGEIIDFMGTGLQYSQADATPSTTYYYTVYTYNGSGNTINYRQLSPLNANVTTLEEGVDLTPPVIVDQSATTVAPNTAFTISVQVSDPQSGVSNVYVTYYPVNSVRQGSGDLTLKPGSQGVYEIVVPASFNTEQGLEYYVQADNGAGVSSDGVWKTVRVQHPNTGISIPVPVGTESNKYRIIAVPLDLAQKSVRDVFGDELGDYDKTKYRLFRYSGSSTTELTASSSIEIGKGYWFLSAESKTVTSGAGTTANVGVDKPLTIPITSGWNQIGNPFNFDVDWDLVVSATDNADKTFGPLKLFNGDFGENSTFPRMTGGFIMVTSAGSDGKLTIPVVKDASRKAAPTPVMFSQTLESDTWAVDLDLKSGDKTNKFGGFGMHPKASEQSDRFDDYTLPRFLEYLEINYNKKIFGSNFTKDIVPTTDQHVWEFEVASNLTDEVIELSWDNSFFGNNDRQLVLWDVNQQRAIDMKTQNSYAFERSLSGAFKVFFGNEDFVKKETLPYQAVFHSASPVPSAGNVTLAFSVPETGGQVSTNLCIYNVMGQKVANLMDQPLPGGYQEAIWNIEDGTKPAAGVYISVLKFGNTTLQKRLVIR